MGAGNFNAGILLPAQNWGETIYTPIIENDVLAAEKAIVDQLKEEITVVEVRAFPAEFEQYEPKHQNGSILVRYDGSTYGDLDATDVVVQWRRMNWEILICVRELGQMFGGRGNQGVGAYGLIEQVRQALTGFVIIGFKPGRPTRDGYRGYGEGYWVYSANYEFETKAIQNWIDPNLPTLQKVTFNETGGQTNIAMPTAQMAFNGLGNIVLGQQNVSSVIVSNIFNGQVYVLGTDYTLDAVNGIVALITGGGILLGSTVNVSFIFADIVTTIEGGGSAPTAPTN